MTESATDPLHILAGPIVRRFTESQLVLWFVTDAKVTPTPKIYEANVVNSETANHETTNSQTPSKLRHSHKHLTHQVGLRGFINHLIIDFQSPLECGQIIEYDINFRYRQKTTNQSINEKSDNLTGLVSDICYEGFSRPRIVFQQKLSKVLHGSCRKPHHDEPDALIRVDQHLAQAHKCQQLPAAMLIMSGDQVYVDDVAGPFLQAIQQVIEKLELFDEDIPGATVSNYKSLVAHPNSFYRRTELLPLGEDDQELQDTFFKAKRKPIFTSVNAKNHLITLSEVLAMYFLVWSPELWQGIHFDISKIPEEEQETFKKEQIIVENFASNLGAIRRALANIPVYMIFDDHDITDDWNLTRQWEELAYGHPFSKRIIGNALFGYWLCQGLGNNPGQFESLLQLTGSSFCSDGIKQQKDIIEELLAWNVWHYELNTQPKVLVLDTRTHRWRSEYEARPSGLLDYERLQELKRKVTGEETVIIVSAAPIFGVKVIEAIQKLFTWFGLALTVDAENWMAHKGTAKVLMQIFTDKETAAQYIILSGDVHYSFAYDIRIRFRRCQPTIHQITASGFKNQFPVKLISMLDKINRYLYGHKSPLNWLTKRRRMNISTRYPDRKEKSQSLVSKSSVGLLEIKEKRKRPSAKILLHDGKDIEFK